jgi:hypothetical protein
VKRCNGGRRRLLSRRKKGKRVGVRSGSRPREAWRWSGAACDMQYEKRGRGSAVDSAQRWWWRAVVGGHRGSHGERGLVRYSGLGRKEQYDFSFIQNYSMGLN